MFRCIKLTSLGKWKQTEKPIVKHREESHKVSIVRYFLTWALASLSDYNESCSFGCVNKQQLSRNFLWLSPQQNFLTLFERRIFTRTFEKAVIEISLFPAIFRSNIRAAFQTVARIFVLTEAIDVSKIRTKFRFHPKFRLYFVEKYRNSFAFFLHSTVSFNYWLKELLPRWVVKFSAAS